MTPRGLTDVLLVATIRACVRAALLLTVVTVAMQQGWLAWEHPEPAPRKTFPITVTESR